MKFLSDLFPFLFFRLYQSEQFHQAIEMYNKCLTYKELKDNSNNVVSIYIFTGLFIIFTEVEFFVVQILSSPFAHIHPSNAF